MVGLEIKSDRIKVTTIQWLFTSPRVRMADINVYASPFQKLAVVAQAGCGCVGGTTADTGQITHGELVQTRQVQHYFKG